MGSNRQNLLLHSSEATEEQLAGSLFIGRLDGHRSRGFVLERDPCLAILVTSALAKNDALFRLSTLAT